MAAFQWQPKRMTDSDMRAVLNYMNVVVPHEKNHPYLSEFITANYPHCHE
jgi:hypothetical protein